MHRRIAALALPLAFVTCGCSPDADTSDGALPSDAPSPVADTSSDPAPLPAAERCGEPASNARMVGLTSGGSRLPMAVLGTGNVAAVYLHQTNGDGLCGWWPLLAGHPQPGVQHLLLDMCGYGEATCDSTLTASPRDQVGLAVDWARDHGAQEVVLVGASMGGAVAVGVARDLQVDRVVDVSGPAQWEGVPPVEEALRGTTVPTVVVASSDDTQIQPDRVMAAAGAAGPSVTMVRGADGRHGYELLSDYSADDPARPTDLARMVMTFVSRGTLPKQ